MSADRPHSEVEVRTAILRVLGSGHDRTTAEITKAVKGELHLTPADLEPAAARAGESKIDQIIANALQSRRALCADGLIERTGRGVFRLTEAGHAARREDAELEAMAVAMGIGDD